MFDKDGNPHFRFHNLCHYCADFNMSLEFQTPTACNAEAGDNDGILKQIYRHVTEIKEDALNQKANDYFSSLCNTNTEKP
jgi:cytochrome oxidase assembly protein ShyY1